MTKNILSIDADGYIRQLNKQFGGTPMLQFSLMQGRVVAVLQNERQTSQALIDLQGGTVLAFDHTPAAGIKRELFFVSPGSDWTPGKIIRGGDQTGFPWFSVRGPTGDKNTHGVARQSAFSVASSATIKDPDSPSLTLRLTRADIAPELSHLVTADIYLDKKITIKDSCLVVEMTFGAHNAPEGTTVDCFLHPYFKIGGKNPRLQGVRDCKFETLQSGERPLSQKIEIDTEDSLLLVRPILRNYFIPRSGFRAKIVETDQPSTEIYYKGYTNLFVWRPSDEQKLPDTPISARESFVCVEPVLLDVDVSNNATHTVVAEFRKIGSDK